MRRNYFTIVVVFVVLLSLTGCFEPNNPASLWPGDNPEGGPAPTITSVTPADTAWTDADTVVIVGTNFSTDASLMHVAFGGVRGEIISSTETEMQIKPPTNFADSMTIKVDRSGSDGALVFAEYSPYWIKNPFSNPGDPLFVEADMIYGITSDINGNVYLSNGSNDLNIIKMLPSGERINTYIKRGVLIGYGLKFSADSTLYYSGSGQWIGSTDVSGGYDYTKLATTTNDLDFDNNGNLFFVGVDAIYKVDPSNLATNELAYDYTDYKLKAVRVYNDYLYVGGVYSGSDTTITVGQQNIWKHSIASDGSLGSQEEVIDWTAYYSSTISAIEFDENGNMFIGTVSTADIASDGIVKISTNGSHTYLYPQLLRGDIVYSVYKMTWTGNYMYCSIRDGADASNNTVIKLNMFSKCAPYHGR